MKANILYQFLDYQDLCSFPASLSTSMSRSGMQFLLSSTVSSRHGSEELAAFNILFISSLRSFLMMSPAYLPKTLALRIPLVMWFLIGRHSHNSRQSLFCRGVSALSQTSWYTTYDTIANISNIE